MIVTTAKILTSLGMAGCADDATLGLLTLCRRYAERNVKAYLWLNVEFDTHVQLYPAHGSLYADPDFVSFEKIGGKMVGSFAGMSGHGRDAIALRETPVREILEVREVWAPGTPFTDDTILDAGQYYLDVDEPANPVTGKLAVSQSGVLRKYYTVWSTFPRTIQVTYTAGWKPEELEKDAAEIEQAVLLTVGKAYRTFQAQMNQDLGFAGVGPVTGEMIQQISKYYDQKSVQQLVGQSCVLTDEVKGMLDPYVSYSNRL